MRGKKKKKVLLPCDLSPGQAGSRVEPTTPHEAALHGASTPLLFQLSGYSPKPKGVFNRGLGITGLTVNSSKVKGLGCCPKPCMLLPWLNQLLGDFSLLLGSLLMVCCG